jgi:hypothetical protein
MIVGLIWTVRGFGDKVLPPDAEDADEFNVEEYDVEDDDSGPVLGNSGMGIVLVRTAAFSELGGELVGEKSSGGDV